MGTVEPYTYKTETPWSGWRAYKEAWQNCTHWRGVSGYDFRRVQNWIALAENFGTLV